MYQAVLCFIVIILSQNYSVKAQKSMPVKDSTNLMLYKPYSIIPKNFYNHNLGFFCEKEFKIQKATGVNLFFRLGSKDIVDFLEQKPNAVKRY